MVCLPDMIASNTSADVGSSSSAGGTLPTGEVFTAYCRDARATAEPGAP